MDKVFVRYIKKQRGDFEPELMGLTPEEFGRRKVNEFLKANEAENTFNSRQRIILVASDFDKQTLSATAWMSKNDIDISCIRIQPKAHSIKPNENATNLNEDMTPSLFLEITRLIPPRKVEDFFVSFPDQNTIGDRGRSSQTVLTRRSFPKMLKLMEWGILQSGDKLNIKDRKGSEAEVIDDKYVKFSDMTLSYNDWGRKVTGWSTINIYDWAVKDGQTLKALRRAKMAEQGLLTQEQGLTA